MSGIYLITNTINNKHYIGSAVSFEGRWTKHKSLLNLNKHKNKHLQNAVNKYGIDNFKFEILYTCSKEELLHYEQIYMDLWKPEYNILKIAGSSLGYKHTEETLAKLRKPKSDEHKKKLSEACKGRTSSFKGKTHTEENKKKHSEVMKIKMRDYWDRKKVA